MTETRVRRSRLAVLRDLPALALTAGLFWLVYLVVFNFRGGDSDYFDHLQWALRLTGPEMLASFVNGEDLLWHVCVRAVLALGVDNIWVAGALVTAAADAAALFLVYRIWVRALPEDTPRWLLALAVSCVFLAGSLTLPGHSFYTGRGAVNTWQNPTNIMVRPFAAAVLYMTVDIYDRRRSGGSMGNGGFWAQFEQPVFTRAERVLYPLCLVLSVDAKPSFLQVFAPALLALLLVDLVRTRGRLLPFCVKLAAAFLPAGLIVLLQVGRFFGEGFSLGVTALAAEEVRAAAAHSAGIGVYYLENGWTGFGPFIRTTWQYLRTVLLPCAFPLFLLAAAPRRVWRGTGFRLGLLCVAVGLLEVMFLHETGARSWHGNFVWGLYLACWLWWTAAVGQYAVLVRERTLSGRLVRWGGTALLAWHTACGGLYVAAILRSAHYYF